MKFNKILTIPPKKLIYNIIWDLPEIDIQGKKIYNCEKIIEGIKKIITF